MHLFLCMGQPVQGKPIRKHIFIEKHTILFVYFFFIRMFGTTENPGLILLSIKDLFNKLDELMKSKEFMVKLSFIEVYNENIKDLLCNTKDSKPLDLW
jgi:hypothetical protein